MTDAYAKKAKDRLSLLEDNSATSLLKELTDFSVTRDF
jgi:geranylgeranyl pyrophosphate synthase